MDRSVSYPVVFLVAILAVIAGAIGIALLVAVVNFMSRGYV